MLKDEFPHLKDSSIIFITDTIVSISGFIFSFALARILPTQSYGEYKFVLSILSVLYIFSLPGIKTAITQSVARGYTTSLKKGAYLSFKISLIGSLVAFLISFYFLLLKNNATIGISFIIISLLFPFIYTPSLYVDYLKGLRLFKKTLILRSIISLIPISITLIIAYFLRSYPIVILSFFSLSAILNLIFLFHYINKNKKRKDYIMDPEISGFGIKLTLIKILNIFRAQYDMLIIGPMLGFSSLAIYNVAAVFANQLKAIGLAVNSSLLPKLSSMNNIARYDNIKKRLVHYLILMGTIFLFLFLVAPVIIPFLFSKKYLDSVRLGQLLLISLFISSPTLLINALFESGKETKKIWQLNNGIATLEIILLSICVPKFGFSGVIFTKFIVRTLASIIAIYILFSSK